VAAAEIWDPATGEFEETGSLAEPRVNHTATSLADGRVLIVGGSGHAGLARLAEVYDPDTGTFTAAGEILVARTGHTATSLPDGRVLVIGGLTDVGDPEDGLTQPTPVAELWDPATASFTAAGELLAGRLGHTATLLGDGTVIVIGGTVGSAFSLGEPDGPVTPILDPSPSALDGQLAGAETWDPETRAFSAAGSLLELRQQHSATLLSDGRVAVIGGILVRGGAGAALVTLDTVEIWQPDTRSFSRGPALEAPRFGHSATLMGRDQVVLIGGGFDPDGLSSVEVWRPR
jgi:hypothetical protein